MSLVLADTSIWVAHFRVANPTLQSLATTDRLICHPLIIVELACGTPPSPRERTLGDLKRLQQAVVATSEEMLSLIEKERCYNSGCGAIDMALLASTLLTPNTRLWTLDQNLGGLAARFDVAFKAGRTRSR